MRRKLTSARPEPWVLQFEAAVTPAPYLASLSAETEARGIVATAWGSRIRLLVIGFPEDGAHRPQAARAPISHEFLVTPHILRRLFGSNIHDAHR